MTLDVEFNENSKELTADFSENEQHLAAELESVIITGGDTEASYNEGYKEGRNSAVKSFWDNYQNLGARTDYTCAFAGKGWTVNNLKPMYDINIRNAYMMFRENDCIDDLDSFAEDCGITIDWSECTIAAYAFYNNKTIKKIENFVALSSANYAFQNSSIEEINNFISTENTAFTNCFSSASSLTKVIFTGDIAKDISFAYSPNLSDESIASIVDKLDPTITGKTATFSKVAVNTGFETSEGAADGSTSELWLSFVNFRSNWTITLS